MNEQVWTNEQARPYWTECQVAQPPRTSCSTATSPGGQTDGETQLLLPGEVSSLPGEHPLAARVGNSPNTASLQTLSAGFAQNAWNGNEILFLVGRFHSTQISVSSVVTIRNTFKWFTLASYILGLSSLDAQLLPTGWFCNHESTGRQLQGTRGEIFQPFLISLNYPGIYI